MVGAGRVVGRVYEGWFKKLIFKQKGSSVVLVLFAEQTQGGPLTRKICYWRGGGALITKVRLYILFIFFM